MTNPLSFIFQPLIVTALLLCSIEMCRCFQPNNNIRGIANVDSTQPLRTSKLIKINDEIPFPSSSSQLFAVSGGGREDMPSSVQELDTDALSKYGIALITQLSLVYAALSALDFAVNSLGSISDVPFLVNAALFYVLALKSRVFNPLLNSRPNTGHLEAVQQQKRVMPSWTPPGFIFPIVWLLLIGPLRAYTSAMILDATGSYCNATIMFLMLHLSIGDVWNTINNVERRYGMAVTGVVMVWLSAALASYEYYLVSPEAGKLLSLSLVWLFIASALVTQTWRLNPTGEDDVTLDPLFPILKNKDDGPATKLIWFEK